ncbi:hypothetical protein HDU99_002985, partial [Rhizoclosmatium hyalinum]
GDEITPYIIPRLGRPYHEQWAEEDGALPPPSLHHSHHHNAEVAALLGQPTPAPAVPQGPREYEEVDGTVYGGDVYIGPLAERILASMIEEGGITGPASVDLAAVARFGEEDGTVEDLAVPNVRNVGVGIHAKCRTTSDVMGLEERLRSEMRFLGLLDDTEVPGFVPVCNINA